MEKITIMIEGMACGMCESHICDCIRKVSAVHKVTASRRDGRAVVQTEKSISEEDIRRAVEGAGYRVLSVETEPYQKKKWFWHK